MQTDKSNLMAFMARIRMTEQPQMAREFAAAAPSDDDLLPDKEPAVFSAKQTDRTSLRAFMDRYHG